MELERTLRFVWSSSWMLGNPLCENTDTLRRSGGLRALDSGSSGAGATGAALLCCWGDTSAALAAASAGAASACRGPMACRWAGREVSAVAAAMSLL